jgi:hypothetical protein
MTMITNSSSVPGLVHGQGQDALHGQQPLLHQFPPVYDLQIAAATVAEVEPVDAVLRGDVEVLFGPVVAAKGAGGPAEGPLKVAAGAEKPAGAVGFIQRGEIRLPAADGTVGAVPGLQVDQGGQRGRVAAQEGGGSSRVDLQACKLGTGRRFTTS